MLRFVTRLQFGLKYYKEIAKLIGMPVMPINEYLPTTGECLLYDYHKSNPKIMEMMMAREIAKLKKLDLVLMREGNPLSLQLLPYTYNIYKEFQRKLRPQSLTRQLKSIQISRRIQMHDMQTKKLIVYRLMKKGYGSFKLIATDNSEYNRLLLLKFCYMMDWRDNYTFELVAKQVGKGNFEFWVCYVHVKNLVHPISIDKLDKKYERLEKKARGTGKSISIEDDKAVPEESESEQDYAKAFNSKAEIIYEFFGKGLDKGMSYLDNYQGGPILNQDPLTMRPERLNIEYLHSQIENLKKKGHMMTGLEAKRIKELSRVLKEKERFNII